MASIIHWSGHVLELLSPVIRYRNEEYLTTEFSSSHYKISRLGLSSRIGIYEKTWTQQSLICLSPTGQVDCKAFFPLTYCSGVFFDLLHDIKVPGVSSSE